MMVVMSVSLCKEVLMGDVNTFRVRNLYMDANVCDVYVNELKRQSSLGGVGFKHG